MSNNTSATINPSNVLIIAYYALSLVIVGTFFNLLTFLTLCRGKLRNTTEAPTLHYMRTIVIFDILMLYGWNLDHYLSTIHGFTLGTYTIASCKFSGFLNYFAAQTSAWLRIFVCLDRYLSISRLHRTWFSHSKNALIIIACIISFFTIFNLHLIIFACFYEKDGLINMNSPWYTVYPLWDHINLVMYNCIPFILMIIFNSLVIYWLRYLRRTSTIRNSRIQRGVISITLVITTFLFLIMTIPATVAYGYFSATASDSVLYSLDLILYTYHITSFPLYLLTFDAFRREFIQMITCKNRATRIAPTRAEIRIITRL